MLSSQNQQFPQWESRAATWLFGLQQNSKTHSNLAIVNLGTEPNRFSIQIFDGKTGSAGWASGGYYGEGSFQLNSLLADYSLGVSQGYAGVVPNNPFVTYAVVIDAPALGNALGTPALSIAHREEVRLVR